jgi:DNA-binding MarR family transcriptional regulator
MTSLEASGRRRKRRRAARERLIEEAAEIARLVREVSLRYVEAPAEADKSRSGLTVPQIAAITALYDRGPLSLKDLSRELRLSHSTVSGIVDRLERRGLVARTVDAQDRRVTRIAVTSDVNTYARETFLERQLGRLLPALEAASDTDRQTITDGLRLLHSLVIPDQAPAGPQAGGRSTAG